MFFWMDRVFEYLSGISHLFSSVIPMLYDQDIEVGKAVRPQLALRVSNASSAWKKVFPCFF
jgi:hypothetical protein